MKKKTFTIISEWSIGLRMVRKLKFHEQKLLRKVNFVNWEVNIIFIGLLVTKLDLGFFIYDAIIAMPTGEQQSAWGQDYEEILHSEEGGLHIVQQAVQRNQVSAW